MGRVVSVANSEKGLGSRMVFRLLLRWAHSGVLGGFVKGPLSNGPGSVALEVEDQSRSGIEAKSEARPEREPECSDALSSVFLALDGRALDSSFSPGVCVLKGERFIPSYGLNNAWFDQQSHHSGRV